MLLISMLFNRIPLNFAPLRLLSFSSVVGIFSCFCSEYSSFFSRIIPYVLLLEDSHRSIDVLLLSTVLGFGELASRVCLYFVYTLTKFCAVVSIVFIDGFLKPNTPGSLREPAVTYLFPANWLTLPLSFGLLMSPWGGHSVFPNSRSPHLMVFSQDNVLS